MVDGNLMACFFNSDIKVFDKDMNPIKEFNILPLGDEHQRNMNSFCVMDNSSNQSVVSCNYFGEMYVSILKDDNQVITNKLTNLNNVVECFCVNPLSESIFCSGDSIGGLAIWDLHTNGKSEIVRSKESVHGNAITSLTWMNEQEILSTGLDDQLLISDTNILRSTYSVYIKDNAITTANFSPLKQVIFTGHVNGLIRLFDDRQRNKTSIAQFRSHTSYISSIKHCPENDNIFISACYDGKIKLWDFRMNLPLYTINSHSDEKIFDVCWLG